MIKRSLKELAEEFKDKQRKVGDLLDPKLHPKLQNFFPPFGKRKQCDYPIKAEQRAFIVSSVYQNDENESLVPDMLHMSRLICSDIAAVIICLVS